MQCTLLSTPDNLLNWSNDDRISAATVSLCFHPLLHRLHCDKCGKSCLISVVFVHLQTFTAQIIAIISSQSLRYKPKNWASIDINFEYWQFVQFLTFDTFDNCLGHQNTLGVSELSKFLDKLKPILTMLTIFNSWQCWHFWQCHGISIYFWI